MSGRCWVSVAGNGAVRGWWPKRPAKHPSHGKSVTIVECVAMPRVRVVEKYDEIGQWFSVTVNGSVLVGFGSAHKDVATERARDLRRALRKGGA